MTTVAIVPVKRFSGAKTRLTHSLSPGTRRALAEAMVTDVLIGLRRTPQIDVVLVVTGEPAAVALATGYDALVVDDPDDAGHNAAARLGIREAVAEHQATRVLLLPGDCPALLPADITALLADAPPAPSVVIVPDRHGEGTNGLLLWPPDVIEPSFGDGSRARHEDLAAQAGAQSAVIASPSLVVDVDTSDDLEALRDELDAHPGGAAHVRGLLMQFARRG